MQVGSDTTYSSGDSEDEAGDSSGSSLPVTPTPVGRELSWDLIGLAATPLPPVQPPLTPLLNIVGSPVVNSPPADSRHLFDDTFDNMMGGDNTLDGSTDLMNPDGREGLKHLRWEHKLKAAYGSRVLGKPAAATMSRQFLNYVLLLLPPHSPGMLYIKSKPLDSAGNPTGPSVLETADAALTAAVAMAKPEDGITAGEKAMEAFFDALRSRFFVPTIEDMQEWTELKKSPAQSYDVFHQLFTDYIELFERGVQNAAQGAQLTVVTAIIATKHKKFLRCLSQEDREYLRNVTISWSNQDMTVEKFMGLLRRREQEDRADLLENLMVNTLLTGESSRPVSGTLPPALPALPASRGMGGDGQIRPFSTEFGNLPCLLHANSRTPHTMANCNQLTAKKLGQLIQKSISSTRTPGPRVDEPPEPATRRGAGPLALPAPATVAFTAEQARVMAVLAQAGDTEAMNQFCMAIGSMNPGAPFTRGGGGQPKQPGNGNGKHCTKCERQGHLEATCFITHPELVTARGNYNYRPPYKFWDEWNQCRQRQGLPVIPKPAQQPAGATQRAPTVPASRQNTVATTTGNTPTEIPDGISWADLTGTDLQAYMARNFVIIGNTPLPTEPCMGCVGCHRDEFVMPTATVPAASPRAERMNQVHTPASFVQAPTTAGNTTGGEPGEGLFALVEFSELLKDGPAIAQKMLEHNRLMVRPSEVVGIPVEPPPARVLHSHSPPPVTPQVATVPITPRQTPLASSRQPSAAGPTPMATSATPPPLRRSSPADIQE